MTEARRTRTAVGIVGGGPAGLMLSHLLSRAGVDSVVVDNRSRLEIEQTVRAGILEADSVRLLVDTGVSDRVLREGHAHDGIVLRFDGVDHRIDFQGLVGESAWLYPQTDVFIDLASARERDARGRPLRRQRHSGGGRHGCASADPVHRCRWRRAGRGVRLVPGTTSSTMPVSTGRCGYWPRPRRTWTT